MEANQSPLVVQYLYVHEPGEAFFYPTARARASAVKVACRYLECAVVQAASLALQEARCRLLLVTNIEEPSRLGRAGSELLGQLDALGVQIVHADYCRRPPDSNETFMASRYVLDAIIAAAEGQPEQQSLWLTDLDCVWPNAELVFASAPPLDRVGAIEAPYSADWLIADGSKIGRTRNEIAELAVHLRIGGEKLSGGKELGSGRQPSAQAPPWIGGELLSGSADTLRRLVDACDELDRQLAGLGKGLSTEEQLLTLAGALGLVQFHDLSQVARRIWTGPRHDAPKVDDPLTLGLWHIPAEKGLSLRRTARAVCRGRTQRLRRDLAQPARMARRFNVEDGGPWRRVRDDGWLFGQRVMHSISSARERLLYKANAA